MASPCFLCLPVKVSTLNRDSLFFLGLGTRLPLLYPRGTDMRMAAAAQCQAQRRGGVVPQTPTMRSTTPTQALASAISRRVPHHPLPLQAVGRPRRRSGAGSKHGQARYPRSPQCPRRERWGWMTPNWFTCSSRWKAAEAVCRRRRSLGYVVDTLSRRGQYLGNQWRRYRTQKVFRGMLGLGGASDVQFSTELAADC